MDDLDQYPALTHFAGAYLHQDWTDEFPDVWAAWKAFVEESPQHAPLIPSEVEALLGRSRSDAELEKDLADLGSSYVPSLRGESAREWLLEVKRRTAAAGLA